MKKVIGFFPGYLPITNKMDCLQVQNLLNAHIDAELPKEMSHRIQGHILSCAACGREARELKELSVKLNTLPRGCAPASLKSLIIRSFRKESRPFRTPLSWPVLAFYSNELACCMAVAGFLIGLFLGSSLLSLPGASDYSLLLAYSDMEGFLR